MADLKKDGFAITGIAIALPILALVVFLGSGSGAETQKPALFVEQPYIDACADLMRDKLTAPASYAELASEAHPVSGGTGVLAHVWFTASNAFGAIGHYAGGCVIENGVVKGVLSIDTSDQAPWLQAANAHG